MNKETDAFGPRGNSNSSCHTCVNYLFMYLNLCLGQPGRKNTNFIIICFTTHICCQNNWISYIFKRLDCECNKPMVWSWNFPWLVTHLYWFHPKWWGTWTPKQNIHSPTQIKRAFRFVNKSMYFCKKNDQFVYCGIYRFLLPNLQYCTYSTRINVLMRLQKYLAFTDMNISIDADNHYT